MGSHFGDGTGRLKRAVYDGDEIAYDTKSMNRYLSSGLFSEASRVSRLGLVVRRSAGKREGRRFDSPLGLTFLFTVV